jgi:group II intron reverse transcriptase/maturase
MKVENVLERVADPRRLRQAWKQVRANAGAAGIDRMTVRDFESRQGELLGLIAEKLRSLSYRFKPARRVLIDKPGTTKKRKLGIPVVMDRIVSQSMNLVLEEIFGPQFTASNFGFRRGKSQHQAIRHVKRIAGEGHEWCASIDLKSFFDEIPHGLILRLIRRGIRDERFVTLLARALKAGVVVDGVFQKTAKGCPQGSPVSPMLSNIVLNELDQELERRGHRYCRWADDFLVFVRTERAAHRVMESITRFLEEGLGLPVNRDKSCVVPVKFADFVSFQVWGGKVRISPKARRRFKQKVREMTRRNNPLSMRQVIEQLNEYLRGWIGYFRIQEYRSVLRPLDEFIRNRLRSMQLKKWKRPKKFQRMMIRLAGSSQQEAGKVWVQMGKWHSIHRPAVRFTLHKRWFRHQGLIFLDDYAPRALELPFRR